MGGCDRVEVAASKERRMNSTTTEDVSGICKQARKTSS